MQRTLKQIITKSPILGSVLFFLLAYITLSILWIQIKDIYGYGVTFVASKFVAEGKDARLERLIKGRDVITASFSSIKGGKHISVRVPVGVTEYFSNAPLTLSLMVSLFPYIKRKRRAYAEALLLLLLFHLLHVFFWGIIQLTETFMIAGIEEVSVIRLSNYRFLWQVTQFASVSFAPFLLVTYIFMRFRR